jgi:hypothetical protein
MVLAEWIIVGSGNWPFIFDSFGISRDSSQPQGSRPRFLTNRLGLLVQSEASEI